MTTEKNRKPITVTVKSRSVSPAEFEALLEKEKEEAAQKYADWPVRVSIDIPLNIMPMDRVDRFEIPLEIALGSDGVIESAGSAAREVGGQMQVHMVGISLRVKDSDSTLNIIQKTLKQCAAPSDTKIIVENTRLEVYDLGR